MHHILGNKVLEYDNELNEILNSEVWTEMN